MDTSKIIKGVVNSGRYTVTAPIIKEDYGLYLQIEGVDLPSSYQVDFSNSEQNGTSVTMIGNSDGVLIPHQFIDTGKDIFAFLYHVGEDYGRTVYKFRIPNKIRPDRTEDTPTPEEQSVIDQAISALNTAVAKTAQDVISADASAQSAQGYAEQAEFARDTAQSYANNAQASATQASTSASQASASATASANSASASAQIKADVEELVDDAQGYAESASQSASASAQSASDAQGYANSASASAQSASGYASQAQTSAQTASAKAQDASGYAQTATQKATESAQSASQALSYKTDAESAKTASQTAQGLAESARDTAVQAKEDAESARDEAQSLVDGISGKVEQIESNTERIESLEDDRYKAFVTDTASGSIASFPDGADDLPLKSLVVNIDPIQDLHGQDSPYPAGGGKNKITATEYGGSLYSENAGKDLKNLVDVQDYTENGNVITVNVETAWRGRLFATGVLPAGDYHVHFETTEAGTRATIYVTDADLVVERYITNKLGAGTTSTNVTLTDSQRIAVIFANYQVGTVTVTNLQVELGSAYTSWTPYENICPISGWTEVNVNHSDADMTNPTTITIDLGQTVYGGKLDVLSGELTVYPYYASYNGETLTGEWISDRDKYVSETTPTIGAQVVNIGAQGVTVQLEPHEVESLYGVNNIWADSGDTEVEYRADTKLFIERLTAPDSADMIADANITSGQYFMVGNNLFRATANIASGASVIVGTNAIRKSLSEALNEINV